jgi:large subunit ribosomal protein L25
MVKTKATQEREELVASRRSTIGSRRVNRLRNAGFVPGVVYGKGMAPVTVEVPRRELSRLLHSKTGEHALVTLKVSGEGAFEKPVLLQAVQHHPVSGQVTHVDFHAIVLTQRLKVKVPIQLKGEPVGVKQDGGLLEHFLREVEVECLPTEIPDSVVFDVSLLIIGQTVHVRDLIAPANTKITTDPEGAVASVQKPKEEKPEVAGAEAATEPEVLREKKEEPEAGAAAAKPAAPEAKKDTKKEAK